MLVGNRICTGGQPSPVREGAPARTADDHLMDHVETTGIDHNTVTAPETLSDLPSQPRRTQFFLAQQRYAAYATGTLPSLLKSGHRR